MGRSFGLRHGSDPMGPAASGTPTVIGPSFGDFVPAVEALRSEGALEVLSADDLPHRLAEITVSTGRSNAWVLQVRESPRPLKVLHEWWRKKSSSKRSRPGETGAAQEKEESVHRGAETTSADGGVHGHK